MKKICKKILSTLMAAAMVVTMLPIFAITAHADGGKLFHYTFDKTSYYNSKFTDDENNADAYSLSLKQDWGNDWNQNGQAETDRTWFNDGWYWGQLNPNIRSSTYNKAWRMDLTFRYTDLRTLRNTAYTLGLASSNTTSEFFGVSNNGNLSYNGNTIAATGISYNVGNDKPAQVLSYVYYEGKFMIYYDGALKYQYYPNATIRAILENVNYVAMGGSNNVGTGMDLYDFVCYEKNITAVSASSSYLTDEVSFNELISSGAATKTGTVTWDSTENAAYFNGGYLTVNSNPLSNVTETTGFTISFDFKRLDTNELWSRFIDINDGTTTNTFAINAGSDSDQNWQRLRTLAKVGGTECNYYASDTGNTRLCAPYSTSSILADGDVTNTWHNLTVIMDAQGYYSYYYDGVLRGTFINNYESATADGGDALGNGVTPTMIKNQMKSMTQFNIGKAIYNDPTFKGYIKNVHIIAQDVHKNLANSATMDQALSFAQAKMAAFNGWSNQLALYKAYYNAKEALDASTYGGDSGKVASSRTALITAINNMKWEEYTGRTYGLSASGSRVYENDDPDGTDNYKKIAYSETGITASGRADRQTADHLTEDLFYPETTMIYDGFGTKPQTTMIFAIWGSNFGAFSSSRRMIIGANLLNSDLSLPGYWHGAKDSISDLNVNWGLANSPQYLANTSAQTAGDYGGDHDLCLAWNNGSRTIRFANYVQYTGTMDSNTEYVELIPQLRLYINNSNSYRADEDGQNRTFAPSKYIRVVNVKRIYDTINTSSNKTKIAAASKLNNYLEGGADTLFDCVDEATQFDSAKINSYFTSSNNWNGLQNDITGGLASVNTAAAATADTRTAAYQALRETLTSSRTIGENELATDYTIAGAYANYADFSNGADFKTKYETVVNMFAALDDNDNASGYNATSLADLTTMNTELVEAFEALAFSTVEVPTVSAGKYLGKNDTITVTNNEGDGTMSYVVTYNDSTTQSGSVADGGTINIFNNQTNKTSATLVVTLTLDGETYDSLEYHYTYIASPRFTSDSAGNTTATQGVYPLYVAGVVNDVEVYAYSNNSFADATTQLQYSYDGSSWFNVSNGGGIYAFNTVAGNTTGASSIYLKEEVTKDGKTCYSEPVVFTTIQQNTFAIYTNNTVDNTFYDTSSTIFIEYTTHYSDDIKFKIKKADGSYIQENSSDKIYTYSKGTGIKLSGAGAIADASTILGEEEITVEAYSYSANNAGYLDKVSLTLTNVKDYDPFIYHESFNGTVSDGTYTSNDAKGVNISQQNTGTISVVAKAGDKQGFHDGTDSGTATDEIGTSADMRKNVLKISGTNQHINDGSAEAYAMLVTNPLTKDAVTKAFAKKKGVTISFWRAIQSSADTKATIDSGTLKRDAIAFRRPYSADQRGYFMIELTGNMSYAETASNYFDVVPGEFDVTQNSLSKYSGYWQHIAVTINPNAASVEEAINVYIDGVPHNVSTAYDQNYDIPTALDSSGGNYAAATDTVEKTIGDLLDMITDDDVLFCLAHDNQWQGHSDNIYLDDIRVYTDVLSQKDIWNTYYDEYCDTPTLEGNRASVTHDPTTITVYTLARTIGGASAHSTVGQEFVDYYGLDITDENDIENIEYYSYGTGLQIYHSTDSVNWEIVGDSQGRIGYQSHDQFVKQTGVSTWTPLEYHAALSEVLTSIRSASNLSYQQGAGHLVWAPHVSYNLTTNKWMMYVAISCWSGATSAIISMESADGSPIHFVARDSSNNQAYSVINKSNGRPNAIDACTYYAHDPETGAILPGELYMAYGAWSQGAAKTEDLCTMRLNANGNAPYGSSAPIAYGSAVSASSGTRICSSQPSEPEGVTGEGAFITYHNGYYYLYVAYGVNDYNYVTRVFRSTSPTGGFVDYNGYEATNTTDPHGTQIMAPHYMVNDNYIYMSTGHDSIYKAVNNNGEEITIHSAHARPVSNEANGYKELPDVAMVTRQIALAGSVTITHPMFYTASGWAISMPEGFNGTDTSKGITAAAIDGIYSSSTLHDIIDVGLGYSSNVYHDSTYETNWDFSHDVYFSHETDTTGVVFSNDGINLDYTYELSYDTGNAATSTTTYITIKDGETTVAEGVVAMHNGIPELSYFNLEEVTLGDVVSTRAGSTVWSVKSDNLPTAADFEDLEDAYTRGDAILKELSTQAPKYTKDSVDALVAAVEAAQTNSTKSAAKKRLVSSTQQGTLDTQESAIETAIANLEEAPTGVTESKMETYVEAIEKVDNIIKNIDSDIYDAEAFTQANITVEVSEVVSASDSSYQDGAYTIPTVENSLTDADVEKATSDALSFITSHYKQYKIYIKEGEGVTCASNGKLSGAISVSTGTDETGTYSYVGAANSGLVATSEADSAWYMSYTSSNASRTKQFQTYGKTFTTPLIGDMQIYAVQRSAEKPNRVRIERKYSDSSVTPVQCVDFVDGSYVLPAAPAIPFYTFVNYTVGETTYAAGATISGITGDITVKANYTKASNNAYAVKVSTVSGDGDIYNESAEYNQKIEASDPSAYAWIETVGTKTRLYYIGTSLSILVTESTTIKAIDEATFNSTYASAVPAVNLRSIGAEITEAADSKHKITINGQVVVADPDNIVECGILIGKAKAGGSIGEDDMILANTGNQTGYKLLRAKSTKMVGANQFTIAVTSNITGEFKYRAYVIYQNGTELVTAYSDVVDDSIS